MPKRKKVNETEMTTEEIAKRLFPKKVIKEAKKIAHEKEHPSEHS